MSGSVRRSHRRLANWHARHRSDVAVQPAEAHALTDELTGLHTGDALTDDLQALRAKEDGEIEPHVLLLLELDGLQRYAQSFGLPAGDALVARLAWRLADGCPPNASTYRLGGGRFAVLSRLDADGPTALIDVAAAALSERGEGFNVRGLCGAATIPAEVTATARAIELADQRLAVQRQEQVDSPPAGLRQIMLRRLRVTRGVEMGTGCTMGELARSIAERVGLDHTAAARTALAAELHDIGKAAIPREILSKPSALDDHEWVFVQRSPAAGERIVSVTVPGQDVAAIVRAAGERYDGGGYPDGLAGDAIPLEARIVAVCGALEAMLSERPYRPARSLDAALSELRSGCREQFDPSVVDALADILHDRAAAEPVRI